MTDTGGTMRPKNYTTDAKLDELDAQARIALNPTRWVKLVLALNGGNLPYVRVHAYRVMALTAEIRRLRSEAAQTGRPNG